ncbi:hypothetical protein BaRGS_00015686 [Batillaria attramentaria]|uniref:Uncharacterized protein n=1 Tax=Batillaria attramentaria TaxID=370345 RepID=A0ABD0L211_9CAEN
MAGRGVLGVAAREHVVLLARGVQESGNPSSSQELHTGLLPRSSGVNLHPDHSNSVDIVGEKYLEIVISSPESDLHPDDPVLVTSMSCYTPPPAPPRPSRAEGVHTPGAHGARGLKTAPGGRHRIQSQ